MTGKRSSSAPLLFDAVAFVAVLVTAVIMIYATGRDPVTFAAAAAVVASLFGVWRTQVLVPRGQVNRRRA